MQQARRRHRARPVATQGPPAMARQKPSLSQSWKVRRQSRAGSKSCGRKWLGGDGHELPEITGELQRVLRLEASEDVDRA